MPTITVNTQTYDVPQSALDEFLSKHAKRELTDEELLAPVEAGYFPDTIYSWMSPDPTRNLRLVAFAKMLAVMERLNGGPLDWSNREMKYGFYYSYSENRINASAAEASRQIGAFYFRTASDRDRFVRLLEPEIRLYFGVEGK